MTKTDMPSGDRTREPGEQILEQDWLTIWQSEMAGLAVDREAAEQWQSMLSVWLGAANAAFRRPGTSNAEPRGTSPDAPPRAAPADAPPDPRDAEIRQLRERLDALERERTSLVADPRG